VVFCQVVFIYSLVNFFLQNLLSDVQVFALKIKREKQKKAAWLQQTPNFLSLGKESSS